MPRACARHILVKTRDEAEKIKALLQKGGDFDKLARQYSTCPSGKKGGSLGEFSQGDMVKAFDEVVFKGPLLQVQGPVKTRFGWHLIETIYRS
ncbi:peptidylprolyl isomerase [Venatoribacter cucullus]|uniref:Peptidyl-prolyl cis-trans isomerase C n=1 Tax=Venatoribacter cucullus TaxID=2661630 RepID=A0A9X7V0X2_9GAMM|nr:peptidylprolyl isomerase [Venatoribacter cucullus]QQD24776.1 peptidylprolyl isomerase [Venatoribacter cucullus]